MTPYSPFGRDPRTTRLTADDVKLLQEMKEASGMLKPNEPDWNDPDEMLRMLRASAITYARLHIESEHHTPSLEMALADLGSTAEAYLRALDAAGVDVTSLCNCCGRMLE